MATISLNTAVGDRDLCAWQPVRGVVWVQTRNPIHAERLSRIEGGRLVGRGVVGGYLRTFDFHKRLVWAIRLMARYTSNKTRTNDTFGRAICPRTNPDLKTA